MNAAGGRNGQTASATVAVVAGVLAATGFVAGIFPIFDSDLFWHLASGRWIVEHGEIPRVDPFRFTSDGAPWIDHEWAFQLVLYGLERAAGLDGLIGLRAAALALFALLLFAVARRAGLGVAAGALVALAATMGVRPRFLFRPEVVTLFALVALVELLERRAQRSVLAGAGALDASWRGLARSLAPILLLVALWVNFHGEALLAPGIVGLFLAGRALERRRGERRPRGVELRALLLSVVLPVALVTLALGLNPYGFAIAHVALGIGESLGKLAAANPEWTSALRSPQPYLFAGIAATAALALAARRRSGAWPALAHALPAAAMAALALTAVRHQALFFAVATPFAARCLAVLARERGASPRPAWLPTAAVIALCAAVAAWAANPPASGPLRPRHGGLAWGFGLAPGRFPVGAVDRLAARPETGPLYNEFAHGGYLLWRLHPPRKIFLDGRMELDPQLLHRLERARRDAGSWARLLAEEGAVGALVRYDERRVPLIEPDGAGGFRRVGASTPNALLFDRALWRLVDWDDETMLFLRPEAQRPGDAPYLEVEPEDVEETLRRAAESPERRARIVAELERKLADDPGVRRARWLLAQVTASASAADPSAAPFAAAPLPPDSSSGAADAR